jgi:hypothetical protein
VTLGNLELVQIIASWAATAPIVVATVLFDERRLTSDQLSRAWPPVSRDAAVFVGWMLGFNVFFLVAFFLVHFVRTRGWGRGVLLGFAWACVAFDAWAGAQLVAISVVDSVGL